MYFFAGSNSLNGMIFMKRAVYTGSFDPVTNGHMDIISRASEIFDVLIVSVLNNKEKTPLFSVEERVKILEEATKDLPNVQIDSFSGLLVDYAQEKDLHVIVEGLRAITDFEYELQMAQTNRMLSHGKIDTVFYHQSRNPIFEFPLPSSRLQALTETSHPVFRIL